MKKTILVSGASGFLGKAVTTAFLSAGYEVLAADRHHAEQSTVTHSYAVDLTDEQSTNSFLQTLFAEGKKIECAALLAGGFAMGDLAGTSYADLEKMMSINFKTVYTVVRPLFQHMVSVGGGNLILIASRAGIEPATGYAMLAYTLSKSMLIALAEALNAEGNKKGVFVHILVPGTIDTAKNREDMPTADFSTWVKPETLAAKMVELCSSPAQSLGRIHRFY